jgi:hypothetical protein
MVFLVGNNQPGAVSAFSGMGIKWVTRARETGADLAVAVGPQGFSEAIPVRLFYGEPSVTQAELGQRNTHQAVKFV